MSKSSIQDKLLEITVTGCSNLMRTEWLGKQDPYVCLQYGNQKCHTRVCRDGDKNPTFQDKFTIRLIEGIREVDVDVWNRNQLSRDCFIARGKIQLSRVLAEGHDDRPWPLLSQTNRTAGDVNVILHYDIPKKNEKTEETVEESSQQQHLWSFNHLHSPPPPHQYPPPTFNRSYSTPAPYSYYYGSSDYYGHQYHHQRQGYAQPPPSPPPFYHEQPGGPSHSQPYGYPAYGLYPPPGPSQPYWH